ESRDPDKPEDPDDKPEMHRSDSEAPYPVRVGGVALRLYQQSFVLVLGLLFVVSFVFHLIGSAGQNCSEAALHGQPCDGVLAHAVSTSFWFESFQNWQSEFLSIGVVVVLSIFLRQKDSPESKLVHAPHSSTGR
ncbi:MAG: hypothetical protein H7039_12545, partial [Bryobacteraceae bacterium]|nr:hypothetical protein [Bryobacteraceae bacterium]